MDIPESAIAYLLKELALVPITLLPIINPLSTASVFAATVGQQRQASKRLARQIAVNGFFVIVAAMAIGTYVLSLFGVSLPVVRLGGGLLVAATGWRMLNAKAESVQTAVADEAAAMTDAEIKRHSFFPMTFPLTTGPGTIAACIALGAQLPSTSPLHYLGGLVVAVAGAFLVALVVYLILKHSVAVVARIGPTGALVLQQLMAFVLLCIGIQLMWTGWFELNLPAP
ncbi:MAG TPA: MarC family protein [Lysobacter sp.]